MIEQRLSISLFLRLTFFFSFFIFFTLSYIAANGLIHGLYLSILGWSAYMLFTPFPGGGTLLYPLIRIIARFHGSLLDVLGWLCAFLIWLSSYFFYKGMHEIATLSHLMHWAVEHPIPYWILCFLSFLLVTTRLYVHLHITTYRRASYALLWMLLAGSMFFLLSHSVLHDAIMLSNIHA